MHAGRDTGVKDLVCLGGFRNVRSDFDWAGFKLELDETQFDWGTVYEIEVETVRMLPGSLQLLLQSCMCSWLVQLQGSVCRLGL